MELWENARPQSQRERSTAVEEWENKIEQLTNIIKSNNAGVARCQP